MVFPPGGAIAWAILETLEALGGDAKRKDICERVTKHFIQSGILTEEQLKQRDPSGANTWQHRLNTVRATMLVPRGWLEPVSPRGIWRLTPAAYAGLFTVRAIEFSEELNPIAERLNKLAEKAGDKGEAYQKEMVQKIKDIAGQLVASNKVGEIPDDFSRWHLEYLMRSGMGVGKL